MVDQVARRMHMDFLVSKRLKMLFHTLIFAELFTPQALSPIMSLIMNEHYR